MYSIKSKITRHARKIKMTKNKGKKKENRNRPTGSLGITVINMDFKIAIITSKKINGKMKNFIRTDYVRKNPMNI